MFKSALKIELENQPRKNRYHVISFDWNIIDKQNFQMVLTVYNLDKKLLERLTFADKLNIEISENRYCVGNIDSEGNYKPCKTLRLVKEWPQCSTCLGEYIPDLRYIFEPTEEMRNVPFVNRPHVVYLAFHGSKPKIGLTSENRVLTRLVEQGADGYAIIQRVQNRVDARKSEVAISKKLKIQQRISFDDFVKSLFDDKNPERLNSIYMEINAKLKNTFNLTMENLKILNGYPLKKLTRKPKLVPLPDIHTGNVVGMKGKYLIYLSDENYYALNIETLQGHIISSDV